MISAKTVMTENVITIHENAPLEEAAKIMLDKHVKSLLVTEDNMPIAIVTERDIIKGSLKKNGKTKVKSIMNKNFLMVSPEARYSFIVKKLREEGIKKFPVVENNKLIGIITETDILEVTRDFTRFHQIMQELILAVFGLVTAFFLFFFSPLGQSIIKSFN
ncbi:MAG: CBS domain-containing protein [Nanoarchaeota archaeon]